MRRRKTAVFFLILGISLSVLAVALNIGWILLNLREVALLVFGVIFFALIITGLILNTIFLVREIRRNEQHDAFLNAVTHELKTPIASIKLYLETLKGRDVAEEKRQEFYDIMLADNERLLGTVEQVLQASRTREKQRLMNLAEIDLGDLIGDTIKMVAGRKRLDDAAIRFSGPAESIRVLGDRGELQTAITNLLDNAVKYSGGEPKISVQAQIVGCEQSRDLCEGQRYRHRPRRSETHIQTLLPRAKLFSRRRKRHRARPRDRSLDRRKTRRPGQGREQRRGKRDDVYCAIAEIVNSKS